MTKTITVHGTVSKFDWSNPHVVVYVDAKNESGEMQHWTIEFRLPGPYGARRMGARVR